MRTTLYLRLRRCHHQRLARRSKLDLNWASFCFKVSCHGTFPLLALTTLFLSKRKMLIFKATTRIFPNCLMEWITNLELLSSAFGQDFATTKMYRSSSKGLLQKYQRFKPDQNRLTVLLIFKIVRVRMCAFHFWKGLVTCQDNWCVLAFLRRRVVKLSSLQVIRLP